jgi:hypothetical protein
MSREAAMVMRGARVAKNVSGRAGVTLAAHLLGLRASTPCFSCDLGFLQSSTERRDVFLCPLCGAEVISEGAVAANDTGASAISRAA